MRILFICAILVSSAGLFSCKKKKTETAAEFSCSITVTSPAEGDTLSGNFVISGTISGNAEMHGYHIGVYRTDNDDLIYENQYHIHQSAYNISETVNHALTDTTNLKVTIEVVVEHEEDNVIKTVNFVFKP